MGFRRYLLYPLAGMLAGWMLAGCASPAIPATPGVTPTGILTPEPAATATPEQPQSESRATATQEPPPTESSAPPASEPSPAQPSMTPAPRPPEPSATAVPEPATATAAAAGPTPPSGEGAVVTIEGFAFAPSELVVRPGTTVTWTNEDSVVHSVFVVEGPEKFDSGEIAAGASFRVTLTQPGTYTYFCGFHDIMMGTVTVAP